MPYNNSTRSNNIKSQIPHIFPYPKRQTHKPSTITAPAKNKRKMDRHSDFSSDMEGILYFEFHVIDKRVPGK